MAKKSVKKGKSKAVTTKPVVKSTKLDKAAVVPVVLPSAVHGELKGKGDGRYFELQVPVNSKGSGRSGDLRIHAMTTKAEVESDYIKLSFMLHEIYKREFYLDYQYQSFGDWVENEIDISYRTAMDHIGIVDNIIRYGLPVERVGQIGWSKVAKMLPYFGAAKNQKERLDMLSSGENLSQTDLAKELKTKYKSTPDSTTPPTPGKGADRSSVTKRILMMSNAEDEVIATAIEKAKSEFNTSNDTTALEQICMLYNQTGDGDSVMSLGTMIDFAHRTYGVELVEAGAPTVQPTESDEAVEEETVGADVPVAEVEEQPNEVDLDTLVEAVNSFKSKAKLSEYMATLKRESEIDISFDNALTLKAMKANIVAEMEKMSEPDPDDAEEIPAVDQLDGMTLVQLSAFADGEGIDVTIYDDDDVSVVADKIRGAMAEKGIGFIADDDAVPPGMPPGMTDELDGMDLDALKEFIAANKMPIEFPDDGSEYDPEDVRPVIRQYMADNGLTFGEEEAAVADVASILDVGDDDVPV